MILLANLGQTLSAQDANPQSPPNDAAPAKVTYPLNVSVSTEGAVSVVDLDLPGVWRLAAMGQPPELFYRGTIQMRKPMNRPRCIVAMPDGSVLVGDSASRDIYRIDTETTELQGLTKGMIGIPMCLAVDPDGKTVYVGDAERRALFKFPLAGGQPEHVAQVNARGLSFDSSGRLWAVTPDDAALVTVDSAGKVTEMATGRPFQFPGGIAHVGDVAYVTDGYGKSVWKVTADGTPTEWFQGVPLMHPVGIAATKDAVLVADPHSKQIFRFELSEKPMAEALLP